MGWQERIIEFFFPTPTICVLCQKKTESIKICLECLEKYRILSEQVGQCKRCHTFGVRANVCDVCRRWPNYLRSVKSCFPYEGAIKEAIAYYKYQKEPWRGKILAESLVSLIPSDIEYIVAIPLHRKREQDRGYNQSYLLAETVAEQLDIPIFRGLVRHRHTTTQVGLSKHARHENLDGAFSVKDENLIKDKRVLLIDDVMTTGSTIEHCARVLHDAGAKSIDGAVLATSRRA